MNLQECVVLVTGGAHRLGRAIALAFGAAGARVIVHYNSSADKAQATLAELAERGAEGFTIQGNLADTDAIAQVVDTATARWGRLDVLVNNSGIWGATPIGSVTTERWGELLDTNLRSAFFMAQQAAPALRAAHGAIVNIADIGVFRPWKHYTPYLVSKGGVATLTKGLARDLAPEVRVNAVAPGPVLLPDDWTAEQAEQSARSTLLGRVGSAEDIGQAVCFLAQADYITGVVLPVDGGWLLH